MYVVCPGMPAIDLLGLLWLSGRDVTEAIQWIKEKEPQVTSEDYGKDLVTSEALFHSHKGLERNLAVMEDKVSPCWKPGWSLGLGEAFGGYLASRGHSKFTILIKRNSLSLNTLPCSSS